MGFYSRDRKPVSVLTFTTGKSAYGEIRQTIASSRMVDMDIKLYQQSVIQNPMYNEVEMIGLTEDEAITTENRIVDGTNEYNVLYVIPSGRLYQVLMKKVK